MKNNPAVVIPWHTATVQWLVSQRCPKRRMVITVLSAVFLSATLANQIAFAGLQQVFVDGQAGRFEQARSELQRLSEELEAQMVSADIMIAGRNSAAIGYYSMLFQVASDCLSRKISPEYGKKLFISAQKATSGQLDEAASLAEEVAKTNPNYPQAYLILGRIRMGNCMQRGRDCDEAISAYQHALSFDKGLSAAYLDLGMLYRHKGRNEKAVETYESILLHSKVPSEKKWAQLMLAITYAEDQDWSLAKKHALEAKKTGFVGIASELLNEIERHSPGAPSSEVKKSSAPSQSPKEVYDRAILAGISGEFSTSVELLTKAKAVEPSNMPIASALQLATQAKEANVSKESGMAVFRSISLGNQGNWTESLSKAKRACDLSQNVAALFVHLGTVYVGLIQAGMGDRYALDAINAYKRALELDPQSGLAYYNLSLAQAATHDWTAASENILKAKSLGIPVPSDVLSEIERRVPQTPTEKESSNLDSGATAAPDSEKGFFDGLLATLKLIPIAIETVASFFKPSSGGIISAKLEAVWNEGGGLYKAGFVAGILIVISLLGGGGGAAAKKN